MALKAGFLHAAGQSACCTQTMMLNVGYLHGKLFPARQCFQQDSVSSRTVFPAGQSVCTQTVMLNAGFLHAAGQIRLHPHYHV